MRMVGWTSLAALSAWLVLEHVRLVLESELAVDEMQYAHGGWLIARGEVIYRDFFEHHFPLLHQLLAVLWTGLGDDPTQILSLRLAMLPVFALAIGAAVWINRPDDHALAWFAVPVFLLVPTLSAMQMQLRPDALSAALFLLALAAVRRSRIDPRLRGAVAGAAFALAIWGSLKVVFYGLPFFAALAADLARFAAWRRGPGKPGDRYYGVEPRYLLVHPVAFLAGALGVASCVVLWLLVQGNLGDFVRWAVLYNFDHQSVYPGFPWWRNFGQLLQHSPWLLLAAGVGVAVTARRCLGGGPQADWLLLAALPSTFLSFAWQTAPYLYSLIPFTLVLALFAVRGLAYGVRWSLERRTGSGVFALALLALWGMGEVLRVEGAFDKLRESSNEEQIETLARLGSLTSAEDPVFHQWAGQIARPSPHFFHFLEASTYRLQGETLGPELVRSMIEEGVTVFYAHTLFPRLPPELRAYALDRFHPLDEHLWIYGQRFVPDAEGRARGTFDALRDDRYFVSPPAAARRLRIDGERPVAPLVRLRAGRYQVELEAGGAGEPVYLLWLPRDGQPFEPRPELQARWRARSE